MSFPETNKFVKEDVPSVLQNVEVPIFQKPVSEPILEETLIIRQEIIEEDLKKKDERKTILPKGSKKFVKPKTEVGNKVEKVKKNRNGKVNTNRNNVSVSTPIASRKVCNNCNSTGHLTFACKKVKVEYMNLLECLTCLTCLTFMSHVANLVACYVLIML